MIDVRFELTTNDPWSVDDAICEGISPLGYWQEFNQSPTQTKPYNTLPLKRRDIQVQTGYTGRCVTKSRFQCLGAQGECLSDS